MSAAQPLATRADTIASVLRNEILSGQYRAGERLPSERDLCERFHVSRGAVREALKQLQQLGIASIQPGGARVVPITECTLDVLGPLLDLNEIPDPKLVDEALHMFGVLMQEAAAAAVEKATDEEVAAAEEIIEEILSCSDDPARQFDAVRKLGDFYVMVADHLVLRLMINGVRTTFFGRLGIDNPIARLDRDELAIPVRRIRKALVERNSIQLGSAMKDLNRLFRDGARRALQESAANSDGMSGK